MVKDYQRLWKCVISTADEANAVRTLAVILADKEGRSFVSCLERKDVGLCIEILDRVSSDFCLPFAATDGLVRASKSTTSKPPKGGISSSR